MKTDPDKLTFTGGPDLTKVKLGNKVIGHIMRLSYGKGYFYQPKGVSAKFRGEVMPTLEAVKRSLGPEPVEGA